MLVLSVAGAFVAGRYIGSYDTEKKFSTLGADISGQRSVETLFIVNTAIERLRASKVEEANKLLVQYAKLQVPGVLACSKSPMCTAFAGTHMQSPAELEKVQALDEHLPVVR